MKQPFCDECISLMRDDWCQRRQFFVMFPKEFECEYHPDVVQTSNKELTK